MGNSERLARQLGLKDTIGISSYYSRRDELANEYSDRQPDQKARRGLIFDVLITDALGEDTQGTKVKGKAIIFDPHENHPTPLDARAKIRRNSLW